MIVKEFEGKNEKEAIDRAIEELGLDRNEIDFEIVESKKPGILFRGGKVKIRVHLLEDSEAGEGEEAEAGPPEEEMPPSRERSPRGERRDRPDRGDHGERGERGDRPERREPAQHLEVSGEFEKKVVDFTLGLLERMGFPAQVNVNFREDGRLGLDIESDGSGILIGKQGKTLEALQFIVNLAAGGQPGENDTRIVLDTQDYRSRRERALVRMANQVAEQVRRGRDSQLLEPLNPFERRLIHTSLARYGDIETISEGDGLYKRIRVIWRGDRDGNRED
jgi:spoIIIJ-associated protein